MDRIAGTVIRVIDGDTFELDVDEVGVRNGYAYNDVERVRLVGVDAPEIDTAAGRAAHARLRAVLQGRRALVEVHARDRYGRVVGAVVG